MNHKTKDYCDELYELIFKTRNGRFFRNGINKNIYMIEFGNMFLNMNCCNLNRFVDFILNVEEEQLEQMIVPSINKIVFQPMNSVGCYAFTLEEFLELRVLLEESKAIIELEVEVYNILNTKS